MALRAARGQAPASQAPARLGAGGATIRHTPAIPAAAAAAPIVAARPSRRPATAPAAPGPHPAKKSPTGACEDARPYCSVIATITHHSGASDQTGRPISSPREPLPCPTGTASASRLSPRRDDEIRRPRRLAGNRCAAAALSVCVLFDPAPLQSVKFILGAWRCSPAPRKEFRSAITPRPSFFVNADAPVAGVPTSRVEHRARRAPPVRRLCAATA